FGYMARVDGKDGDAIGEQVIEDNAAAGAGKTIEELCWDQLKTCYDPEIPVNIVDLGLVYKCDVTPLSDGGNKAEIRFTLTAPGCGMGDVLREDIRKKIASVPGVTEADVQVLFDPPWNLGMMSDAAKLQLGMLGEETPEAPSDEAAVDGRIGFPLSPRRRTRGTRRKRHDRRAVSVGRHLRAARRQDDARAARERVCQINARAIGWLPTRPARRADRRRPRS